MVLKIPIKELVEFPSSRRKSLYRVPQASDGIGKDLSDSKRWHFNLPLSL